MAGYEDRYEDRSSSRKHSSRGFEQDMSRMRESKRDRGRDRERSQRENHKDRKDDRGRDRYEDNDHHHSRNNGRYRDNDHNRDRRHGHSFLSKERSRNRSRSRSHSPAKSKRTSGFDMAPPGATVLPSAVVAGELPNVPQPMTGLFTPMVPLAAQQFGSFPMMPSQSMTQQATRHARRVYVGGLPPMANEQTIATFFSQIMSSVGGNSAGQGDAVVNVYINHEKKFAFVEMRSVEEASNAMALDGIIFEGVSVRVRRPTDYNPSLAATLGPSQPSPYLNLAAVGLTPGALGGAEGPERIFVGGLPYYFTDGQIRELLESFGPLRGFDIVKDRDTGNSKGYGFCVYQDPSVTDIACAALNGLKMGDKTLTVRRATASTGQARPEQELILQQAQHLALQKIVLQTGSAPSFPGIGSESISPLTYLTKIVCLTEASASKYHACRLTYLQVASVDELRDDDEYEEILEDMREEGGKFGSLLNVIIPRPIPGETIAGVGKVFLEYADTTGSAKAKAALHGRKFGDNIVTAVHYPEESFSVGDYGAINVG